MKNKMNKNETPMTKRTKASATLKRRYLSGILMYRERNNPVTVPANTKVNILRVGPKETLCSFKDKESGNEYRVWMPNANLPGMSKLVEKADTEPVPHRRAVAAEAAV